MRATKKRATERRMPERRMRRSGCLADALRLQLEVCREAEGLEAIVVADELGFCVAHAGGDGKHDALAAQLPVLADPARHPALAAESEEAATIPASLSVTTFAIAGATLHACAVGAAPAGTGTTSPPAGAAALARVASGFARLLAG